MENLSKNKFNKFKIPQQKIHELNSLLNPEKLDDFFVLLEKLVENGKIIYKKYGNTLENKEKLLVLFLKQIADLINNLNIRRVHNSSEGLNIEKYKYKNLQQLKSFFRIRGIDFLQQVKKGFSCNIFNYYIYGLLRDLSQNDPSITYFFELNKFDNHGKLIIEINKNRYSIDSVEKGIRIKKEVKEKRNKTIYSDYKKYLKDSILGELNQKTITYQHGKYKLFIQKNKGKIYISFHTKPLKKLNIHGFKRLSKYFQIWIKRKNIGKVNDINKLKEKIINFGKTNKEKKVLQHILEQIGEKRLKKITG